MRKIICLLPLLFIVFISGCKKEEIKGPQGDPGAAGAGGNANINTSSNFVVNASQWVADSINEYLKVVIPFPALTKDVVDKGTVKVFRQSGTTSWIELPFDTGDLFMQFGFQEGALSLYYINIEGGIPASPSNATYRMSIISLSSKAGNDQNSSPSISVEGKTNHVSNIK